MHQNASRCRMGSMRQNHEKEPVHQKTPNAPTGLLNAIMERIKEEQRLLTIRRRITLFSLAAAASFAVCIPALNTTKAELAQSGIAQFLSLALSDPGTVFMLWSDFALSVLESIPVLSIAVSLAAAFTFLISLKALAHAIGIISATHRHTLTS